MYGRTSELILMMDIINHNRIKQEEGVFGRLKGQHKIFHKSWIRGTLRKLLWMSTLGFTYVITISRHKIIALYTWYTGAER